MNSSDQSDCHDDSPTFLSLGNRFSDPPMSTIISEIRLFANSINRNIELFASGGSDTRKRDYERNLRLVFDLIQIYKKPHLIQKLNDAMTNSSSFSVIRNGPRNIFERNNYEERQYRAQQQHREQREREAEQQRALFEAERLRREQQYEETKAKQKKYVTEMVKRDYDDIKRKSILQQFMGPITRKYTYNCVDNSQN